MREAFIEAGKEFARIVVLAIIPVIILGLEKGEVNPKLILITGGIALLRAVDKMLHEWGKEENNKTLEGGLTRF